MDFLEMEVNAVKLYFNRNWTRKDMMSSAPIPEYALTILMKVYLTLFCAMSAAAYGSYFIQEAWLVYTVLCCVACLLWLYFTPPWRVRKRVILLMVAAFCFGASGCLFTKYFFEINQSDLVSFLQGAAIVLASFWFGAWNNKSERGHIYIGALTEIVLVLQMLFDITQWMLKVFVLLALYIGYLFLYSQEILYDARFGEIDVVNYTFTFFFCLPAIVVHAVRLSGCKHLATETELKHDDTLGTIESRIQMWN